MLLTSYGFGKLVSFPVEWEKHTFARAILKISRDNRCKGPSTAYSNGKGTVKVSSLISMFSLPYLLSVHIPLQVFRRLFYTGEPTGKRDGDNMICVLVPTSLAGCEKATPSMSPALFRMRSCAKSPPGSAGSSGVTPLGIHD